MTQKPAIRVVATGARLAIGALVAVACVAGVATGVAFDEWPRIENEAAQVSVLPTAGDTTLVCSGSFRAIGQDVQNARQMSSAGEPALTVDSNGPRADSEIAAPDVVGGTGPKRFVGSAEQSGSSLVAASESITLAASNLSGLAASACREPRTESWLLGGTVETGTSDLVILSNPGDVTATATLTVFGAEQAPTKTLVPAGTQIAVPLASIAAGLQQPVVRITAAGAPLRAVLQSSLIRTLDPSGIDLQDTAGVPSTTATFAGVQVAVAAPDSEVTVLRLLATEQTTTASITVRAGKKIVQQTSVPLEAATPAGVNLGGLDAGVYSVSVQADAPIVGAVWQSTGATAGTDFAWMTAAPAITGDMLFAVPAGPNPRLHLVNSGEEDTTVSLAPTSGAAGTEITVSAGDSLVVDALADTTYALSVNEGSVHAAIVLSDENQLAGWPLWPAASEREAITVYP